ncbi:MAG: MraY family glycosyltransferase, partial [Verrucomicrobiota bacterium]
MPRLGGLAVFGGFCFPWAGFYILDNRVTDTFQNYEKLFYSLVLGATAMLLLGIYDDLKGLTAPKKFAVQILVAIGLYLGGFRITLLSNPFGEPIELGWLSLPASVFWIVAITNAMNLLDGIDGLVTGVTASIALSLAIINVLAGNIIIALLTLCLAGSCLGFLPHNFAPARIFLGDTGSLFLGVVLACIGMYSLFKETTATLILVPVILFGLPLFDTTSVVLGRMRRRAPLFQADKSHVHHRLLQMGLTQKQAATFLYGITVLLGGMAVWLNLNQSPDGVFLVGLLTLGFAMLIWMIWRRHSRSAKADKTALGEFETK